MNFIFLIKRLVIDKFYFLLFISLDSKTKIVDEFSAEIPHAVFIFALRYDFIVGFSNHDEVNVILSNEIKDEIS